ISSGTAASSDIRPQVVPDWSRRRHIRARRVSVPSSRGEARHRLVGDDGSTGCGVPTAWRDGEARRTPALLQRTVDLDTHGRTGRSRGDALVVAALAIGACDWVAVARGAKRVEYVCNPLALILLIAAAVAYRRPPLPESRWAFTVAALCLSLAGD